MPTKHVVKSFGAPAYYHVYNRASGERKLFRDNKDRQVFLGLLKKHLSENEDPANDCRTYDVLVAAYCLMGTHFHLLLFQPDDPSAISGFMRSVSTAYSMYYNRRYRSKGHVFQSSYRASHIDTQAYLQHITRYIHLNPRSYKTWQWSSYNCYVGMSGTDWVHPELILEGSNPARQYEKFVAEYATQDRRKQYSDMKLLLAE